LSMILVPDPAWGMGSIFNRTMQAGDLARYSSGRVEIWTQTAAALLERPWFGHGQGQFRYQVPAALGVYNHPHNSVLQFAYDWGLLGAGALAAAFVPLARSLLREKGPGLRDALPAVGAFSGLGLMSLVDGSLYYAYPVMVFMICIAVIATRPRDTSQGTAEVGEV
jgi:O-antigen ligase